MMIPRNSISILFILTGWLPTCGASDKPNLRDTILLASNSPLWHVAIDDKVDRKYELSESHVIQELSMLTESNSDLEPATYALACTPHAYITFCVDSDCGKTVKAELCGDELFVLYEKKWYSVRLKSKKLFKSLTEEK